mmetsp:Transcript_102778/g.257805  ORF Transcript_102778/g.257805 Transcript_102778/m.257805 type:complete len:343 (+) Transcript_102778:73-1101(+)
MACSVVVRNVLQPDAVSAHAGVGLGVAEAAIAPSQIDNHVGLHSISRQDRDIAFGVAGDPIGSPVLVFYPAGGNRHMVCMMHELASSAALKLICVNRPGKAGTTLPMEDGPMAHAVTACDDTVAVLDHLRIQKASLLFFCAGTPFALLFAARYPERSTGRLMGSGSWVSPVDFEGAQLLYQIGGTLPTWFVARLVGSSFASGPRMVRWLPESALLRIVRGKLAHAERDAFDQHWPAPEQFARAMQRQAEEAGGEAEDMQVLLSSFGDLGAHYNQIVSDIVFFHGEDDKISPIDGVEWLAGQLPGATLRRLPLGTHDGLLLLLHSEVRDALCGLASAAPVIAS